MATRRVIPENENSLVFDSHTAGGRDVLPENENVFASRGKGAGALSSAVAVVFTATAEESVSAPFPRLTKTFSFFGITSRLKMCLGTSNMCSLSRMACWPDVWLEAFIKLGLKKPRASEAQEVYFRTEGVRDRNCGPSEAVAIRTIFILPLVP